MAAYKPKTGVVQKNWIRRFIKKAKGNTEGLGRAFQDRWGWKLGAQTLREIYRDMGITGASAGSNGSVKRGPRGPYRKRLTTNGALTKGERERLMAALPSLQKAGIKISKQVLEQLQDAPAVRIPAPVRKRAEKLLGANAGVVVTKKKKGHRYVWTVFTLEGYKGRVLGGRAGGARKAANASRR